MKTHFDRRQRKGDGFGLHGGVFLFESFVAHKNLSLKTHDSCQDRRLRNYLLAKISALGDKKFNNLSFFEPRGDFFGNFVSISVGIAHNQQ